MMRFDSLVLVPVLFVAASTIAAAQGRIHGCVTDAQGSSIPGARIVAAGEATTRKAVTDPEGCYRVDGVPPGTYSVTATIPGFIQGSRERVEIQERTLSRVDFALCRAPLDEIDWIVPSTLEEMWRLADLVVRLRISATRPAPSACPTRDVVHTAMILEQFKPGTDTPPIETVAFVQEQWSGEQNSYRRGDEQIVFLLRTASGYARVAGPYSVFDVDGEQVSGYRLGRFALPVPLKAFLARLRPGGKR